MYRSSITGTCCRRRLSGLLICDIRAVVNGIKVLSGIQRPTTHVTGSAKSTGGGDQFGLLQHFRGDAEALMQQRRDEWHPGGASNEKERCQAGMLELRGGEQVLGIELLPTSRSAVRRLIADNEVTHAASLVCLLIYLASGG